ncbi:aspartate aminotransferase family protein [Pseudoroseicyclus aestuarii]|uniref:Acetylornithine aminotransferase n=1 Tax=Pseudoroseicyclus aestuarii TaxID=1795041 RepID=A0A318STX3_9RHOB|nr:aspartate aminotransferase family protein [Pseudoroseicyclus aestuarii]PYE85411.1 acetylornithine aminotransferase [Pseudoroseicyclus aestuarii]
MIPSVLPTYNRAPLAFESGEGAWLTATDGRRYLDFGSGIAVNALGHAHPELVRVLTEQAGKLWHVSNVYTVPEQERLAEALTAASFADTVFFTNSGTEAMELAVKMARKHFSAAGTPEKMRILSFEGAFHGRSSAAIAAAPTEKMAGGFGPLLPGFTPLPFLDLGRVEAELAAGDVAAILVEPVQGEGGIRAVADHDLRELRRLAGEAGALLIFDEVQCGMGRTGRLFAHEWAGVTPDIMMVAKGIGGGFPLGAVLATVEAASGMTAGTHGSTYGGNPLGCAIGAKVMEIVSDPAFLGTVRARSGRLRQGLEGLVAQHPDLFEAVRGTGLILGLKCKGAPGEIVAAGYGAGILTVAASDNVVRLLPPLTITEAEVDEALTRLEAAASTVEDAMQASEGAQG